ncbi:hypothetical protein T492DRAFT_946338 [Pavlovales sp. CCMP2436]|nr:hypothetical protein T492DRAFT_946338 [Pavlovales sp. CCMP2436]|eukprot:CAMPEP_0179851424 /NCGR_PEP_ID=MMETSP0982-20121206/8244_1 /TAXON_ID=483367 /ORGANISM="non described non described, Strain CCMP 2436" /LENGTH=150 /DNA_ID=CAMNT_0021736945 /DNA_START=215 /DNA_END=667 /DNA_ORIENTATION=-
MNYERLARCRALIARTCLNCPNTFCRGLCSKQKVERTPRWARRGARVTRGRLRAQVDLSRGLGGGGLGGAIAEPARGRLDARRRVHEVLGVLRRAADQGELGGFRELGGLVRRVGVGAEVDCGRARDRRAERKRLTERGHLANECLAAAG